MRRAMVMAVVALAAPALAAPAQASFPGQNGRIAYADDPTDVGPYDIYSINPDGTGETRLTTDPGNDWAPDWSPSGQRILFQGDRDGLGYQVYVMNANGSAQTRLTDPPGQAVDPAWSSDERRVAFGRNGDLWIMDADGSNEMQLTNLAGSETAPAWSPDGQRIAFEHDGPASGSDDQVIRLIRPDGTGLSQITQNTGGCEAFRQTGAPDWSPDGTRIVYLLSGISDGSQCMVMYAINPDGTGRTTVALADSPFGDDEGFGAPSWSPDGLRISSWAAHGPYQGLFTMLATGGGVQNLGIQYGTLWGPSDWQPLPVETLNPHPRPKSATPLRVSLVPAFEPCTAPNRTHGPPLAFGSCNPPRPGSTHLTIGVGDGSPALARGVGHVRMGVVVGVPGPPDDSDVTLRFSLTNVMHAADLSEYAGELRTEVTVRRTDRDPPGAAPHSTTMDFPFGFTVPCAPTPGTSLEASTCATETSVNAVIPLAVEDTHRAVWELDKLRVYDGGPDEDADTEVDNALFMTQGVFVP